MQGLIAAGIVAAVLAGIALTAVRKLARQRRVLAETNEALAARVSELATLEAAAREILATTDPGKIRAIVERECRKVLDVDAFFVGEVEPGTGELRIAGPASGLAGLASWAARERRAVRIDDAADGKHGLPFPAPGSDDAMRSALALPLHVGERVVGVLAVASRKAAAYDDHHLSVLATIAQQAAVALEHVHHDVRATVDPLTGLHLREYWSRRAEVEYLRAKRYSGTFSILLIDLDGFKAINDKRGRGAGDRYLRAIGSAIRARMRGADLPCRYGGDEFSVLLPETDAASARAIAERLRGQLAELVVDADDGAAVRTTVSIGIATYPEHDAGAVRGLLLRADQALYKAKRSGRDRVA
jgi:diguanylate cyclase (GGDEF)-like protein